MEDIGIETTQFELNKFGWIKLHRTLLEWEWYTNSQMVHIFIHLILSANSKTKKWLGNEINRGQLITSLSKISSKTGLSIRTVRTCLNRLISTGELTIKPTNKYSIITICNYELYQNKEVRYDKLRDTQNDNQLTSNRQTTDNKQDINKELKKDKEINILFTEFWDLYNKKVGRDKSEDKWNNLTNTDREKIIKTLPYYLKTIKDKQYQKNPETYLNSKLWNDDFETNTEMLKVIVLNGTSARTEITREQYEKNPKYYQLLQ